MDWRLKRSLASVVIAAMAAACAGGAELPSLPELPGSNDPTRAQGRVSDVYTLIARGARMCWFGADGALKETHIFHAALDPPSRGEVAEIAIQEIDRTQVSPWGAAHVSHPAHTRRRRNGHCRREHRHARRSRRQHARGRLQVDGGCDGLQHEAAARGHGGERATRSGKPDANATVHPSIAGAVSHGLQGGRRQHQERFQPR